MSSILKSSTGSNHSSTSNHSSINNLSQLGGSHGVEQQQQQLRPVLTLDASTAKLMYQTSQEMSSYIQQIANEPTIGLFHVQDHIRRNIPKNVELKKNIKALGEKIEEKSFDIDYSTKTIKTFSEIQTFSNISSLLQQSIERANKLVNNKSLLFVNSQMAAPSSSKTFSSFQQQHKIYQQQNNLTPSKSNSTLSNDKINEDNNADQKNNLNFNEKIEKEDQEKEDKNLNEIKDEKIN
ncbi:hypothetical protein ACTFIU_004063 [Dictyostelium citrinum]